MLGFYTDRYECLELKGKIFESYKKDKINYIRKNMYCGDGVY